VIAAGAGYFAQFQLRAWQRLTGVELVAVADTNSSQLKRLQQNFPAVCFYEDLQQALDADSFDIVDIITPPATHSSLIEQACAHPRVTAIICQKPFCENLEQARQAVALSERLNKTLIVHENFRFQPWYRQIKSIIDSGIMGDLYNAHFKLRPGDGQGPDAYLDRQPYFQTMSKFLIHETGIHWIDIFRFLFGEPKAVYADLQQLNPAISGEDTGYFAFHYASGLRAYFDGNRLLDHATNNTRLTLGTMTVEGSNASMSLYGNGQIFLRQHGEPREQLHQYQFDDTDFAGDCVYLLQQHIVSHLINETPLQNSAADYLANVELENAIYQSAATQSLQVVATNASQ